MPGAISVNPTKTTLAKIILLSWLLVGTLDIVTACIDYYINTGKGPENVLNYVASGALGKSAFKGGTGIMLAGLLFHYIVALIFTVFFFLIYPRMPILSKSRIITGIAYGIFIWCIMNLIVVQLSKAPHAPISAMKIDKVLKSAAILIVMIGLPLSFIAYRHFHRKNILKPEA